MSRALSGIVLAGVLMLTLGGAQAGAGPGGFPLPKDATASSRFPAGAAVQIYEVPRARDAVIAELRAALKAEGWTILSEETSPRGALRLDLKKGDGKLNVRVTGDATRAGIILAPAKAEAK